MVLLRVLLLFLLSIPNFSSALEDVENPSLKITSAEFTESIKFELSNNVDFDKCPTKTYEIEGWQREFFEKYEKKTKEDFEFGQNGKLEVDEEFIKFFKDPHATEHFIRTFAYIVELPDTPTCVSQITIASLVNTVAAPQLELKIEDMASKSAKLLEAYEAEEAGEKNGGKDLAFLFGHGGVQQIVVNQEGYKCAHSLLNPQKVVALFEIIMRKMPKLKKYYLDKEHFPYYEVVNNVRKMLQNRYITWTILPCIFPNKRNPWANDSWQQNLELKWKEIEAKIQVKLDANVHKAIEKRLAIENDLGHAVEIELAMLRNQLKKFAIWLFSPRQIVDMIRIILFITGTNFPVAITQQSLHLFGIDALIEKQMIKIGAHIAATTGQKQVAAWAFGKNGVFPLFLRDNAQAEDDGKFDQLVDKYGAQHKVHVMKLRAEVEFLKKIAEEVIDHKGKPIHELMDHLLGNLEKIEEKVKNKMKNEITKWNETWEKIKTMDLKDIKEDLKRFAVWLVTPERVNNLVLLMLTITGTGLPVYLTLQTAQAFGITNLILNQLEKVHQKAVKDHMEKHPDAIKLVEFVIGEKGIVPMFLQDGQFSENGIHKNRLADEASIIKILVEVIVNHQSPGVAISDLYEWLLARVQGDAFRLELIQRWNHLMEVLHKERQEQKQNGNGKVDFGDTDKQGENKTMGKSESGLKSKSFNQEENPDHVQMQIRKTKSLSRRWMPENEDFPSV